MYRQNEDIQSPRVGFSDIFIHTQARVIIIIIIIFFFGGGGEGSNYEFHYYYFLFFFFFFFFGGGGGGQKNEYSFGDEDFVDIFGGSSQNWTI